MLDSIDRALDRSTTTAALAAVPAAAVLELLVQDVPGELPGADLPATPEQPAAPQPRPRLLGVPLPHVHRYRYAGDDAFSASSLYRCRCGVVKPGL